MSKTRTSLLAVGALILAASIVLPQAANAQLIFDWGGQEKVNDTGRQMVRINADAKPGEIIVSFTDRKLYLITAPGQALSYPVAIPREQDRWEGRTTVTQKRENPSWTPTPTMLKENPKLPRWVPGGHPMNPLGNRALYLGSSFYRIHGTDAPWTIGTAVSKGCIRMYNKDALDVYEKSKVGAKVLVTWKAYQAVAEGEPQSASREEAPAAARANAASRNTDRVIPAAAVTPAPRPQKQESRYSDIFGTPEPQAGAAAPQAMPEPPPPASRPTRTRDNAQQLPREPRRNSEAVAERTRSDSAAKADAAPASVNAPASTRNSEQRPRPAAVETGSIQERRPRAKAIPPATEQAQPADAGKPTPQQAQAAPQPDTASRALEAAERAAAAAERAAAAAERAEKAAAARAAAQAAPAAAPAMAD